MASQKKSDEDLLRCSVIIGKWIIFDECCAWANKWNLFYSICVEPHCGQLDSCTHMINQLHSKYCRLKLTSVSGEKVHLPNKSTNNSFASFALLSTRTVRKIIYSILWYSVFHVVYAIVHDTNVIFYRSMVDEANFMVICSTEHKLCNLLETQLHNISACVWFCRFSTFAAWSTADEQKYCDWICAERMSRSNPWKLQKNLPFMSYLDFRRAMKNTQNSAKPLGNPRIFWDYWEKKVTFYMEIFHYTRVKSCYY